MKIKLNSVCLLFLAILVTLLGHFVEGQMNEGFVGGGYGQNTGYQQQSTTVTRNNYGQSQSRTTVTRTDPLGQQSRTTISKTSGPMGQQTTVTKTNTGPQYY
jgi:hypothetical protein